MKLSVVPLLPFALAGLILTSFAPESAASSCKASIRNTNILTTTLLTVVNHWARRGRSFTFHEALRSAAYGAVGGYGFYKAKETVGDGNIGGGLAMAYLSSSMIENVILDAHPFGYFRYGVGPAEFRFSTPLSPEAQSFVTFELDPVEATHMLVDSSTVDSWKVKNGLVYGVASKELKSDDLPVVYAKTGGRHVVFNEDYLDDQDTWQHEAVHVVQNIQYQTFFSARLSDIRKRRQDAFGSGNIGRSSSRGLNWVDTDMRFGWFHMPMGVVTNSGNYAQRWDEVEAAQMGEGHDPHGADENAECVTGLSFAFNF